MRVMRKRFLPIVTRWLPALLVMVLIFAFSAIPADEMPRFDWADFLVKKGGHMAGYGLLALSYWRGLGWEVRRGWLAWLLAVLYAVTDEFHQSFTPGRQPSLVDVLVFDALGAAIGLFLVGLWRKRVIKPQIHTDLHR